MSIITYPQHTLEGKKVLNGIPPMRSNYSNSKCIKKNGGSMVKRRAAKAQNRAKL
jgi:hypothetical protein